MIMNRNADMIDHAALLRLALQTDKTVKVWNARAHVADCPECSARVRAVMVVLSHAVEPQRRPLRDVIVALLDRAGHALVKVRRAPGSAPAALAGLLGGALQPAASVQPARLSLRGAGCD